MTPLFGLSHSSCSLFSLLCRKHIHWGPWPTLFEEELAYWMKSSRLEWRKRGKNIQEIRDHGQLKLHENFFLMVSPSKVNVQTGMLMCNLYYPPRFPKRLFCLQWLFHLKITGFCVVVKFNQRRKKGNNLSMSLVLGLVIVRCGTVSTQAVHLKKYYPFQKYSELVKHLWMVSVA